MRVGTMESGNNRDKSPNSGVGRNPRFFFPWIGGGTETNDLVVSGFENNAGDTADAIVVELLRRSGDGK